MHIKGQPPPKKVAERELITNSTVYECIAAPHPADIKLIRDTLLETPDITSCLNTINMLKTSKGLALADILAALGEELSKIEVPPQTRVTWLEGLADVEYRLSGGASETVQTGGLVGVVRLGMILSPSEKKDLQTMLFTPRLLQRTCSLIFSFPGVDLMTNGAT